MSTRCEHYLILGTKLEVPKEDRDDLSEKWSEAELNFPWCGEGAKGKMGILWDGMGGRYILAGKCLAVADDEGQNSFGLTEVSESDQALELEVFDWIANNDLVPYGDGEIRTYLVSHYH